MRILLSEGSSLTARETLTVVGLGPDAVARVERTR